MTHPSFGVVPEKDFLEAIKAPALKTHEILRKYDPLFGLVGTKPAKKFQVSVSKTMSRRYEGILEIEAKDKEHAKELARKMRDEVDWEDTRDETDDDFWIDGAKEIKE